MLDAQVVGQADRVHQAGKVVVPVVAPAEDLERQVDLGVTAVQHLRLSWQLLCRDVHVFWREKSPFKR